MLKRLLIQLVTDSVTLDKSLEPQNVHGGQGVPLKFAN